MKLAVIALVAVLGAAMADVGAPQVFDKCNPDHWAAAYTGLQMEVDGHFQPDHLPCDDSTGVMMMASIVGTLATDDTCTVAKPDNVFIQGKGTITQWTRRASVKQGDGSWKDQCLPKAVSMTRTFRICGHNETIGAFAGTEADLTVGTSTYHYRLGNENAVMIKLDDAQGAGKVAHAMGQCVYMFQTTADGIGSLFTNMRLVSPNMDTCNAENWKRLPGGLDGAGSDPICAEGFVTFVYKLQGGAAECPQHSWVDLNADWSGVWSVKAWARVAADNDKPVCTPDKWSSDRHLSICSHNATKAGNWAGIDGAAAQTFTINGKQYTFPADNGGSGLASMTTIDSNNWFLRVGGDKGGSKCLLLHLAQDGSRYVVDAQFMDKDNNNGGCQGTNCGCQGSNCGGNNDCNALPHLWMYNGQVVTDQNCGQRCQPITINGAQYFTIGQAADLNMRQLPSSCFQNNQQ